jgi:hypothetical protein
MKSNKAFKWTFLSIILIGGIAILLVSNTFFYNWFYDTVTDHSIIPKPSYCSDTFKNKICSKLIGKTIFNSNDEFISSVKCEQCFELINDSTEKINALRYSDRKIYYSMKGRSVLNLQRGLEEVFKLVLIYVLFCSVVFVILYILFSLWGPKYQLGKLIGKYLKYFWDKDFLIKLALILLIIFLIGKIFIHRS